MSMAAGVVVEKESEYILVLAPTGLRELDGCLQGGSGWFPGSL